MSLNDIFAAIRWWAALMIIGAAATPLTFYLFRRLPDRGYAFTKLVGLLIVSYLFWMLGSLGILGNNLGGILFALLVLISLSAWATTRLRDDKTIRLQDYKTQILITELLFAVLFALWVWVRAQNPAITDTEKPMEFAFLNAIGRSPTFPPVDPWLSGFAISYYYFGYVMISVIGRLAVVAEPIAFNLGIAWLVAGTGTAAFGLVYNLIHHRDTEGAKNNRRAALVLGLIAAIALPLAGNLEIGLEVLYANGVGSDSFWQWLDVRDFDAPAIPTETPRYETSSWWWWRSSRVIHEYHLSGRPEDGLEPIAEFPGFSFALGDMHPHVLALPFAFLSLTVAYLWYLESGRLKIGDLRLKINEQSAISNQQSSILPLWAFTALLLGGLSFLNTWDVLIHLFVMLGAFLVGRWLAQGWHRGLLTETGKLALGLIIPAIALYLPFYLGFRSQASAPYLLPMLMRPTRLAHFLIIFGMPLFGITILVVALTIKQRFRFWRVGLATAVSLLLLLLLLMLLLGWIIAASPEGAGRIIPLADELGLVLSIRPDGVVAIGWGITAVFSLIPAIITAKLTYFALTLLLLTLLAFIVMIWTNDAEDNTHTRTRAHAPLPFILLLVAAGALLTLGPEFVYLRDNFGQRINTIFKFYYQAWVMFGVAGIVALDYLWRKMKIAGFIAATCYGLAFLIALLFPYYAVTSRAAEYRGPTDAASRHPATLNGLAQVERYNPGEYGATLWLRDNIEGTPTIVEAVGGQYSGYGRISANTGLPAILGWAGHEYQWRGSSTVEPGLRDPVVRGIYESTNWDQTALWLNTYNVEYIVVGELERSAYNLPSDKFAGLEIAYSSDGITIYHWQPD